MHYSQTTFPVKLASCLYLFALLYTYLSDSDSGLKLITLMIKFHEAPTFRTLDCK